VTVAALVSAAVLAIVLPSCATPSCMESGYVRPAVGSASYGMSSDPRGAIDVNANRQGSLVSQVTMRRFRPFGDGTCDTGNGVFTFDLGPECKLEALVLSREYDSGKSASLDFIVAEAMIFGGQSCKLALDGDRTMRGVVNSGNAVIHPRSLALDVGINVKEWSGDVATGFIKYSFDGTWD